GGRVRQPPLRQRPVQRRRQSALAALARARAHGPAARADLRHERFALVALHLRGERRRCRDDLLLHRRRLLAPVRAAAPSLRPRAGGANSRAWSAGSWPTGYWPTRRRG